MEFSATQINRADFSTVSASRFARAYLPRKMKETVYHDRLEERLRKVPQQEFSPFRDFRTYFNVTHSETYTRLTYLHHASIAFITPGMLRTFRVPVEYVVLDFHPLKVTSVDWLHKRKPSGECPLPAMWGGSSTTTPPMTENPTLFDLLEDDAHAIA